MKRFAFLLSFIFALAAFSSCSPKYGCPVNEKAHVQPDKKGRLPSKSSKSSSQLFSKDMRKRMGKK